MGVKFLPYFKDLILAFLFYEVPREQFIKGRLRAQGSLKRWGSLNNQKGSFNQMKLPWVFQRNRFPMTCPTREAASKWRSEFANHLAIISANIL